MLMMSSLFADGVLVDIVLIVVVLEAIALLAYWRWKRRGVAPADLLPGLCSGALMLVALRAVLAGSSWLLPTLCLTAAGLAHLVDVMRRWRK